jgi:hypothetical protein
LLFIYNLMHNSPNNIVQEFPIHKKDKLGRIVYSLWNNNEKTIKKYWQDTKLIKILYKYYGNKLEIEAFDKKGNNVFSYLDGKIKIAFDNKFSIDENNNINFVINRDILIKWWRILKQS